jgi:hypothetical protein
MALLLLRQFGPENKVEELDGILKREQPADQTTNR